MTQSINAGMPIAPGRKSNLPLAFNFWADRLIGREPEAAENTDEGTKGARGWFRQFGFSG